MPLLLLALALVSVPPQADSSYVYKAVFIRAAPGALLQVIALYQGRMDVLDAAVEERPFIMRHRQGDQWDLMLLYPIESFATHYSPERLVARRRAAERSGVPEHEFERRVAEHVAWREELFVKGPRLDAVRPAIEAGAFFHVEMFIALPGKRDALYREREMENAYAAALDRPENLIFTKVVGAAWDQFTLGVYRGLSHYAESEEIPADRRQAAALAAGFEGRDRIGTYLRTLILLHHDTLLGRVD
jgi:hypothetical protein